MNIKKSIVRFFTLIVRAIRRPSNYWNAFFHMMRMSQCALFLYHKIYIPVLVMIIRRKKTLNVVFLAMSPDMWKYDGVFHKLQVDKRFHPVIVTAMRSNADMKSIVLEQEAMVQYFSGKRYEVIRGYDGKSDSWIDLSTLKPDIIFHTQPYEVAMKNAGFLHWKHLGVLHCYTPYSFITTKEDWNWCNPLQEYAWMLFYVGKYQLGVVSKITKTRGSNVRTVGYSLEEELGECAQSSKENIDGVWRNDPRKRVIWAPHHSVGDRELFKVSSFLEIADEMIKIRNEYKDRIIFAFKPHPILRTKLCEKWDKERIEKYYSNWASAENSFDAQGDYHKLFVGSDAMIHCCGSFMSEYLYTNKPVQYVYAKTRNPPDLGEVGNAALGAHYSAFSANDIRKFLDKVVLGGKDDKKRLREEVRNKYLMSENGAFFSENVYSELLKGLGWKNG